MWVAGLLVSFLCSVQARCVASLVSSWTMDEMGGTKINDRIGRRALNVPSGFAFVSASNPQGLSGLRTQPDLDLIESIQAFSRPVSSTVTGWFRTTNISEMAIYSWRDNTYNMVFRILAGRLGFYLNSNAFATSQVLTREAYNDDKWHFFAATMSDELGTGTLYVDTHLLPDQVPLVWSLGSAKQHNVFQIGGLTQSWGSINFDGYLDDLRIYSSVLNKEDVVLVATFVDTPCSPDSTLSTTSVMPLSLRAYSNLNIVVEASNSAICEDAGTNLCTNDRYGVAMSVCSGTLSGFQFAAIRDNIRLGVVKNVDRNSSVCVSVYDGTKYVSETNARLNRLCSSSSDISGGDNSVNVFGVRGATSPISTNSFGSLVVGSGSVPVNLEIALTTGSSKGENPSLSSFYPVASNFSCSRNQLKNASWNIPMLTDNTLCSRCAYQAWFIPTNKIATERANPRSVCGLRMYGQMASSFTTTFFQDFRLPLTAPPGEYVWAIVATNGDGAKNVIATFDSCVMKFSPDGGFSTLTASPTSSPFAPRNKNIVANSLKLNVDFSKYPPGPTREVFQMSFLNNLSLALATNVSRFNATTFQGGNLGFDVRDPLPGESDQRTAEDLSALLYTLHNNPLSSLYFFIPITDSDPSSFQSSSRFIQQQQLAASGQRAPPDSAMSNADKLALGLGICGAVFWCCLVVGRLLRIRSQQSETKEEQWQGPDRVVAVHAYRQDQADPKQDLLFEVGTIINVVSRECDDGPGWIIGQLNGRTGMVPKAYVRDYFGH